MQTALDPYPAQLSDGAIAALLPVLPPLDACATPIHAAEAAGLHLRFSDAAMNMRHSAAAMREIWQQWQLLPVCPAAVACQEATAVAACVKSIATAEARRDEARISLMFEKHKGNSAGLSKDDLMEALKEVDAPILAASQGSSPESIFKIADVFAKGVVDLHQFDPTPPLLPFISFVH